MCLLCNRVLSNKWFCMSLCKTAMVVCCSKSQPKEPYHNHSLAALDTDNKDTEITRHF